MSKQRIKPEPDVAEILSFKRLGGTVSLEITDLGSSGILITLTNQEILDDSLSRILNEDDVLTLQKWFRRFTYAQRKRKPAAFHADKPIHQGEHRTLLIKESHHQEKNLEKLRKAIKKERNE